MKINRVWAMPNKNTFTIKPIGELIDRYMLNNPFSIDPISGDYSCARSSSMRQHSEIIFSKETQYVTIDIKNILILARLN
jgi:hypothetical protein